MNTADVKDTGSYSFTLDGVAWRVRWKGIVLSPYWSSKGAADAYLTQLNAGKRLRKYTIKVHYRPQTARAIGKSFMEYTVEFPSMKDARTYAQKVWGVRPHGTQPLGSSRRRQ